MISYNLLFYIYVKYFFTKKNNFQQLLNAIKTY
nr:MAG TPA: hypothetical protein [Caudoviricetes sp.]